MQRSGSFRWHPQLPSGEVLPVLRTQESTAVYLDLHLSNYGKFQARMDREGPAP